MKRAILATTLVAASTMAAATPVFHPSGPSLSYGAISNEHSLSSFVGNPAAPAMALDRRGGGFGLGIISSVGVGAEFGDIPNLESRVQAVSNKLSQTTPDFTYAKTLKSELDDLLITLGGQPYLLNADLGAHIPSMPLYIMSKSFGAIVVDANFGLQTRVGVLDGPVSISIDGSGNFTPQTDSALYLKAATVGEVSVGYSRPVLSTAIGDLSAGVRGNYYMVGLAKTLFGVALADQMNTLLQDELQKKRELQSGFGVDLGVLWTAGFYRLGATVKNINSPSFDYNTVGVDCGGLSGASADSCFLAQFHSDRIDMQEKYVMDPQVRLEASVLSPSHTWFVGLATDVNPVHDPLANEIQMAGISAGYATRSWLLPGFRLGVHTNLAGTQLSYVAAGLTLFKSVNVDLAYGLNRVDLNNTTSLPRKLALNIGTELTF